MVGYFNKLPSGVPCSKHRLSFTVAYGATKAHPAHYARDKWRRAEAHWSTSATNVGTTRNLSGSAALSLGRDS